MFAGTRVVFDRYSRQRLAGPGVEASRSALGVFQLVEVG